MVDCLEEAETEAIVDFVGAFDDLGCEFFVFHFFDRINPGEMSLALRFTNFTGHRVTASSTGRIYKIICCFPNSRPTARRDGIEEIRSAFSGRKTGRQS